LEASYAPFRAGLKPMSTRDQVVVSTLVGVALGDNLLDSTDRRVVDSSPTARSPTSTMPRRRSRPASARYDIGPHLAGGLSGGNESNIAMWRTPDWQQFVLDQPMAEAPGTRFYYNSATAICCRPS